MKATLEIAGLGQSVSQQLVSYVVMASYQTSIDTSVYLKVLNG